MTTRTNSNPDRNGLGALIALTIGVGASLIGITLMNYSPVTVPLFCAQTEACPL